MGAGDEPTAGDLALLAGALEIRAGVERFLRRWEPAEGGEPAPGWTWEALERQLVDLAPRDLQAEMARGLVARIRAHAPLKPAEMVLREVLGVAALILDES
jgi:hypothetical protein